MTHICLQAYMQPISKTHTQTKDQNTYYRCEESSERGTRMKKENGFYDEASSFLLYANAPQNIVRTCARHSIHMSPPVKIHYSHTSISALARIPSLYTSQKVFFFSTIFNVTTRYIASFLHSMWAYLTFSIKSRYHIMQIQEH